ncbi:MAG: hypothetical protein FWF06_06615 [Symbiobacteriaceae bacterium]|nr:hypothetical protein [Symbiobacteriaceae bacterium]
MIELVIIAMGVLGFVFVMVAAFYIGMAILAMGALWSLVISSISFFTAVKDNLDPYLSYHDKNPLAPQGVKRNYFFGPGLQQFIRIILDAFAELVATVQDYWDAFTAIAISFEPLLIGEFWWPLAKRFYYLTLTVGSGFFGFIWMLLFSILLGSILLLGMLAFFIPFALLWSVDRLVLMLRAIQSRCPNCKHISVIPVFLCSGCSKEHKQLVPGPYGVWRRSCSCHTSLATTFLSGRSKLQAICPYCAVELAASNATQYGIQLVGGAGAGKTTFLTSFWHLYQKKLLKEGTSYRVHPEAAFSELEEWFQQGVSAVTAETNAQAYSIIHRERDKTPFQLTLYDIAGESFEGKNFALQQRQFRYCEGVVLVIDPTGDPEIATAAVTGFIDEHKSMRGIPAREMSSTTVAVVIAKGDLFLGEIGLPGIDTLFRSHPNRYQDSEGRPSYGIAQDVICRLFLQQHGFGNLVNLLVSELSHIRFFPLSAMGREMEPGKPYNPWGVLEPMEWLLEYAPNYRQRR